MRSEYAISSSSRHALRKFIDLESYDMLEEEISQIVEKLGSINRTRVGKDKRSKSLLHSILIDLNARNHLYQSTNKEAQLQIQGQKNQAVLRFAAV